MGNEAAIVVAPSVVRICLLVAMANISNSPPGASLPRSAEGGRFRSALLRRGEIDRHTLAG
jgi:hypothetical protein